MKRTIEKRAINIFACVFFITFSNICLAGCPIYKSMFSFEEVGYLYNGLRGQYIYKSKDSSEFIGFIGTLTLLTSVIYKTDDFTNWDEFGILSYDGHTIYLPDGSWNEFGYIPIGCGPYDYDDDDDDDDDSEYEYH